jgi:hypothetical protein
VPELVETTDNTSTEMLKEALEMPKSKNLKENASDFGLLFCLLTFLE